MSEADDKWTDARRRALRNLAEISAEEDAAITRAAEADPDNPPLDDDLLAAMEPTAIASPETIEAAKRARGQRGPQRAPTREAVTLRLDREVTSYFRATGPGWQSRINAALVEIVKRRTS